MATIRIDDGPEPITLDEARAWVRADPGYQPDDDRLTFLISAVREACESACHRALLSPTFELVQDEFTDALELDYGPVLEVLWVRYVDADGVQQELDAQDYLVDDARKPGYVVPAPGKAWPATQARINAVRVRYRAGYGEVGRIPKPLMLWMRLHLAHYYRNAEAAIIGTIGSPLPYADSLLETYRQVSVS